jgi:hypothetical protein
MNLENTKIDFVIPLHRSNPLFRSTVESIIKFYFPKTIFIITPFVEINKIKWEKWNTGETKIVCISEDLFFEPISKSDLELIYTKIDENSRKFGWWYQQILKMGAVTRIPGISDPYMVWDSDLIPLRRWEIYPTKEFPNYRFAILQKNARSEWNISQYKKSIYELLEMHALEPNEGTFVPHHFVMYKSVLKNLFEIIERKSGKPWYISIISLSSKFWRFSEYKCIATFMAEKNPELLNYHSFEKYGNGLRFRDSIEIFEEIKKIVPNDEDIPYNILLKYVKQKWNKKPDYLQLEHL